MSGPGPATTGKNWGAIFLGAVIAIIGLVLAIGGVWLAALGGSLYYVITGVAMMIAGWLLFRQQLLGGCLYIAIVALTVIWAFWEVGANGWALVPREIGRAHV